jgi:ribonuclease R
MTKHHMSHDRLLTQAHSEANAVARSAATLLAGRPPARGLTIDGPTSRDLDDAFWLEGDAASGYQLAVSIADVGALISEQRTPALDQLAYARAFTRYGAERVVPMLAGQLSEDHLSLLEGCPRPTITITIPLDARLQPGEPHIALTVLTSRKRLSYAQADQQVAHPRTEIASVLRLAHELACHLLQVRRARGALALHDLAAGWVTTEEGILRPLEREERYQAQIIVQEFMILVNQVLARWFAQRELPALYRNHTPGAHAPQRAAFLEMLETALHDPEQGAAQQMRASMQHTLTRAGYGPVVQGHFGLNLPAYLHLTSPLRRYADLVNQRLLHAALQGEPLPYTRAELEEIATHLNQQEQEMKEAKSRWFLSAYEQQLHQTLGEALQTGADSPLAQIGAQHFHSLLRLAAESGTLQPAVERELFRRLEEHLLEAADLFTLVFRFPHQEDSWQRVKRAVIRELVDQPALASGLLHMGQQALGWSEPVAEFSKQEVDGSQLWVVRVRVRDAEQWYTSALHRGARKTLAQQYALIEILAHLAGVAVPDLSALESPAAASSSAQSQPSLSTPNYKGQLQEALQARQWASPTYNIYEQSGPSHAPLFTVQATLTLNGTEYSAQGRGKSKREAEQQAAEQILQLIPWASMPMPIPQPEPGEKQAVSVLHELRQGGVLQSVTYSYEPMGPDHQRSFQCRCTVLTADAHTLSAIGAGHTKKEAAQAAAEQAIAALRQYETAAREPFAS